MKGKKVLLSFRKEKTDTVIISSRHFDLTDPVHNKTCFHKGFISCVKM